MRERDCSVCVCVRARVWRQTEREREIERKMAVCLFEREGEREYMKEFVCLRVV